jgi:hypothetical protein
MMTASETESLGTEPVRSLEVRWIFSGELAGVVDVWFARFPAETTVLKDAYLLDPHLPGLSVKVREGRALEVKAYWAAPGVWRRRGVPVAAWSPAWLPPPGGYWPGCPAPVFCGWR